MGTLVCMKTLNISDSAFAALSELLDVNDDDEELAEAGIDPAALASLRAVVQGATYPVYPVSFDTPQGIGG